MKDFLTRPAWIEIDLDKFENNMKEITKMIGENTELMSVVKSDSYRLGAIPLSKISVDLGIKYFAVATLSEALILRKEFPEIKILVLGYTPENLFEDAIKNHIILTIYSLDDSKVLNEKAKELSEKAVIHIAIDSGMSRIGFTTSEESKKQIKEISNLKKYLCRRNFFSLCCL
ncbi:alanine racemase [Peptoniphilus timonensis]|uniref:alanine racemase n=1 Tax=Peptoniphilus timonensis TaxID=1268254 RepID=UPI0002D2815F|nr:alanine racemase [Peptoniphilus timonensis]